MKSPTAANLRGVPGTQLNRRDTAAPELHGVGIKLSRVPNERLRHCESKWPPRSGKQSTLCPQQLPTSNPYWMNWAAIAPPN